MNNIYFFKPYSFEKNLAKAYNQYMSLLPDENDWAVLMDGDVAFLENDFGDVIKRNIEQYDDGNVGMFGCFASRTRNRELRPDEIYKEDDYDLISQKNRYIQVREKYGDSVKLIDDHCTGFFLCVKKKVWQHIPCPDNGTLRKADENWSHELLKAGYKLLCMQGMYVLHYYRAAEGGAKYKKHLNS